MRATAMRGRYAARPVLLATLLMGVAVPCQAEVWTFPFHLVADRFVVVHVNLDDTIGAHFVLDTGSTATVVTPALARRLGLVRACDRRAVTHAATEVTPTVVVRKLRLGDLPSRAVSAVVTELTMLENTDARIEGVLGQDVLSRWSYRIDYAAKLLRVDPEGTLDPPARGVEVPLTWLGRRIMVPLELGSSMTQVQLRVALDSAATTLTVFEPHPSRNVLRSLARVTGIVRMFSLMGSQRALKVEMNNVSLAGHALRNAQLTLADRPDGWGARGDGLLPTSMFRAVQVDSQSGRVWLVPKALPPPDPTTPD